MNSLENNSSQTCQNIQSGFPRSIEALVLKSTITTSQMSQNKAISGFASWMNWISWISSWISSVIDFCHDETEGAFISTLISYFLCFKQVVRDGWENAKRANHEAFILPRMFSTCWAGILLFTCVTSSMIFQNGKKVENQSVRQLEREQILKCLSCPEFFPPVEQEYYFSSVWLHLRSFKMAKRLNIYQ